MTLLRLVITLSVGLSLTTLAHGQVITPNKLILNEYEASNYFTVQNTTSRPIRYRVSLIPLIMNDQGQLEEGLLEHSAEPYLRFGPRVITLPPGTAQSVRLQAMPRRPQGEFRAHLNFEPIEAPAPVADSSNENASFGVSIMMNYKLPVILRSGPEDLSLNFEGAQLTTNLENGNNQLNLIAYRQGSWSAQGELRLSQNGQLLLRSALTVYENLDHLDLHLDLPAGTQIDPSLPITLEYTDKDIEGFSYSQDLNLSVD